MAMEDQEEVATEETWQKRATNRQRQIDIGKDRPEYKLYFQLVQRRQRLDNHPQTPDPNARISKRAFDRQLSTWRRKLHDFEQSQQGYTGPSSEEKHGDGKAPARLSTGSEGTSRRSTVSGRSSCGRMEVSPCTESSRADSEERSPAPPLPFSQTGSSPRSRTDLRLAEHLSPPLEPGLVPLGMQGSQAGEAPSTARVRAPSMKPTKGPIAPQPPGPVPQGTSQLSGPPTWNTQMNQAQADGAASGSHQAAPGHAGQPAGWSSAPLGPLQRPAAPGQATASSVSAYWGQMAMSQQGLQAMPPNFPSRCSIRSQKESGQGSAVGAEAGTPSHVLSRMGTMSGSWTMQTPQQTPGLPVASPLDSSKVSEAVASTPDCGTLESWQFFGGTPSPPPVPYRVQTNHQELMARAAAPTLNMAQILKPNMPSCPHCTQPLGQPMGQLMQMPMQVSNYFPHCQPPAQQYSFCLAPSTTVPLQNCQAMPQPQAPMACQPALGNMVPNMMGHQQMLRQQQQMMQMFQQRQMIQNTPAQRPQQPAGQCAFSGHPAPGPMSVSFGCSPPGTNHICAGPSPPQPLMTPSPYG